MDPLSFTEEEAVAFVRNAETEPTLSGNLTDLMETTD